MQAPSRSPRWLPVAIGPVGSKIAGTSLLAAAMTVPLLLAPIDTKAGIADAEAAPFAVRPVLFYLAGYFLFGAGYIAYMTFMIAYVRDLGGGGAAQSAF